ncbi:MAG: phosphatase PAP2 family protein [Bacteroidaceae bacterium]|nr:phosphatase PAP2 family protein [Bacteroidaceae bacterium]MBR4041508.1 phosphatase PAP2 family protein [Bacteroidaceae bacterium]
MDIQRLIDIDKQVMLALNGSDSLYMDGVMKIFTTTSVWIPVAAVLLFIVLKNNTPRGSLLTVLAVALTILACDQISSGLIKPIVARLRPSHDPSFMHLIDTFNGYRSGSYSFTSSHACNSFGIFTIIALIIRNRALSLSLLLWACINSFSRIYLGVHYPGDILCGAIVGTVIGSIIFLIYHIVKKKIDYTSVRITSNYTRTGYLVDDVQMMTASIYAVFTFISIYALIYIHNNIL